MTFGSAESALHYRGSYVPALDKQSLWLMLLGVELRHAPQAAAATTWVLLLMRTQSVERISAIH